MPENANANVRKCQCQKMPMLENANARKCQCQKRPENSMPESETSVFKANPT